ncbi:MAG: recombinase [Robiginitomaculum sp.]|nr:MAG: recombinase [Robiginitomaculum sp.]
MRRSIRNGQRLKDIKVVTKKNGTRYIYRRVGVNLIKLPDLPENHPDFLAAYVSAGNASPKPKSKAQSGTIAALVIEYRKSSDWLRLADSTKRVRIRILDRIRMKRGAGLVGDLLPAHIRKDLKEFKAGAANNRLKVWRALLNFAVNEGLSDSNPSIEVKPRHTITVPHRRWTDEEIEIFRRFWPIGSPQRMAFEVIYWTGARCVDARLLGQQMIDLHGWLTFKQIKTGGLVTIPIIANLPPWAKPLATDQKYLIECLSRHNNITFIVTNFGAPRSQKGLSQWFSKIASQAGLAQDATAHGLRKARAAKLAEIGAEVYQIGAWTGHETLKEIQHYTRQADKKKILLGTEQDQNAGNPLFLVSKNSE